MSAKKRKSKKPSALYLLALIAAAALFFYYYITENPDKESWNTDGSFVMQVIDVGQGDSILLGCDGEYMLVDSGESEYSDTVLEHIGDKKLKYLVATHPHSDHIGGMTDIITEAEVQTFLMPEKEHTSQLFASMLDAVEKKNIDAQYIYAGDRFKLGSADITVVSPAEGYKSSNLNNWSAVLLVEYQDVRILLTGDSEASVEEEYILRLSGKVDILKVAHHGSDTSSSEELLAEIRPSYAAISVGAGNKYGHPIPAILSRISKYTDNIFRTDMSGDLTFTVKEGVISYDKER